MTQPAPLVSIPQARAPHNSAAQWFAGAGGLRLRAALFQPDGPPRGSVVVNPGRTEFIEKYYETIADLTGRGFVVLIHDWRGQGLSDRLAPDRLMGHAEGYGDFLADHGALLTAFEDRLPKPWIALGHSMGGGLTLLALAEGERRFSACILSAPMLGVLSASLPLDVGRWVCAGMALMGRSRRAAERDKPGGLKFENQTLTHDRDRFERWRDLVAACPDLDLGPATWGWVGFALAAAARLRRRGALERIDIPVSILAAGDERLVLNAAMRAAAARLPQGRFMEIPGAWHELLMETDDVRAVFWRAFDDLTAGL